MGQPGWQYLDPVHHGDPLRRDGGTGPAGPTYLNVPLEVLLEPWEEREAAPVAPRGTTVSLPDDIAAVLVLLAEAENPVIVTETAGREADGMRALVDFAEALRIPVVEPGSAVCANFPRNHDLHADGDIEPFMDTADLILLVNCRAPFYPPSRRPSRARVVVVDETITHSRVVQRHMLRSTPDSYLYVQGGLGQGIAWALGAKLASPERPVVLTVGDGAFMYNPIVQSLGAARAHNLPLLIVVFNNRQYRSMKTNHLRFYPEGTAVETGEFLGVDLGGQPELSAFAEPFGMHAESVAHAADLVPALSRARKAVQEGTTAIVNVAVSR